MIDSFLQGIFVFTALTLHSPDVLLWALRRNKTEQIKKCHPKAYRLERINNLTLFADNVVVYVENPNKWAQKFQKLMSKIRSTRSDISIYTSYEYVET